MKGPGSAAVPLTRIIDAHIHLSGRKDDALIPYARKNGLAYTFGELKGLMKENGIESGILLSPPLTSGSHVPNEDILALCRSSGGLLFPILTVEPNAKGVREAVSLAKRNRGFVKGFKVLLGYFRVFAYDRLFSPMYRYAEDEGLPVLFHTGDTADPRGSLTHSHPLTLDRLANSRPGLKMVACHFGNPWILEVGELLYKHENVYADLSGLAVGGSRHAVEYAEWLSKRLSEAIYYSGGADKVIFGTDYPVSSHSFALQLVAGLGVDGREKQKILSSNARKVFPFGRD